MMRRLFVIISMDGQYDILSVQNHSERALTHPYLVLNCYTFKVCLMTMYYMLPISNPIEVIEPKPSFLSKSPLLEKGCLKKAVLCSGQTWL